MTPSVLGEILKWSVRPSLPLGLRQDPGDKPWKAWDVPESELSTAADEPLDSSEDVSWAPEEACDSDDAMTETDDEACTEELDSQQRGVRPHRGPRLRAVSWTPEETHERARVLAGTQGTICAVEKLVSK